MKLSLKLLFLPALLFALVFAGCSGKDDNPAPSGHKIQYKAEVSSGSTISSVIYFTASGNTTVSSLAVTKWESAVLDLPASAGHATVAVVGVGANAQATMKVQVWVDGVMKKESTATGQTSFGASASFTF